MKADNLKECEIRDKAIEITNDLNRDMDLGEATKTISFSFNDLIVSIPCHFEIHPRQQVAVACWVMDEIWIIFHRCLFAIIIWKSGRDPGIYKLKGVFFERYFHNNLDSIPTSYPSSE